MTDNPRFAQVVPAQLASQHPGTWVECNIMNPTGDGVSDVNFLLQGPVVGELSRWYDTYNSVVDESPDWYALHFPKAVEINSLFFMHGPIFVEGGWWANLQVQYLEDKGRKWKDVSFTMPSPYDFQDKRGNRQPFEAFQLRFVTVRTRAIRLLGKPGGQLRLTTMAYLAADHLTREQAREYLSYLKQPTPGLLRFMSPDNLWNLIIRLREVTRLAFDVQLAEGLGLDHFLDEAGYEQFHIYRRLIIEPTSLYQILGTHEGWSSFGNQIKESRAAVYQSPQPQIVSHHGGMSSIIIPMVIDDEVLGTIENREFISINGPDMGWHEAVIERLGIEPDIYYRALEEVPVFTQDRIRAITGLLQVIIQLAEEQIQRSRMMARLQATKEAAEEANQAKSEFVSLVAHELKNPMTTVKGFIDLLLHLNERGEPSKTTLNEYLHRSLNGILRMESLIKDLSDLSQIEAGYLQLKPEALSLQEVLAESIEAVELQLEDKSQQLVQRIPEELPPVRADRARLGQIIMNLLSNACKYTPERGKITIYVEPWDKAVHIAIQDTGIGIQQKDQSQIFEKFFRSTEARNQTLPGTGLGLNITRNLVELHGGRIWFESELHRGSTFHFTLPIGDGEMRE